MLGAQGAAKKDYPTYPPFRQKWIVPEIPQTARNLFESWKLNMEKLPDVITHPARYPYFYLHLEIYFCWIYLCFIEDMRTEEGDSTDRQHLLYMHGLDLFVTNDKRLARLFQLVHPMPKRAVTLEQLVSIARS